ncbi:MAG: pyrroline-5-carboxylate reductase [Acidobacteriota bacterium]|nr:pyrroline-5-carboxylate reductase [Acidobacteriota bacterium]
MSNSVSEPLLLIGGGRMGEALAAGLTRNGWDRAALVVVEAVAARRDALGQAGLQTAATIGDGLRALSEARRPGAGVGSGVGVVIAVKPHDVEAVSRELAGLASGAAAGGDLPPVGRVLSIAAGVTLEDLDSWLAPMVALRAMPNTPALVGEAASVVSAGRRATEADVGWAAEVLSAVGSVTVLPESALDAVTGLSGSGPAYVFLVAEALIDAGVLAGLARPVARDLAVQTLLGSARMLAETGEEPAALRAGVTSPGGTTAAGLRALEGAGVRAALLEAVMAATERARQLGQRH